MDRGSYHADGIVLQCSEAAKGSLKLDCLVQGHGRLALWCGRQARPAILTLTAFKWSADRLIEHEAHGRHHYEPRSLLMAGYCAELCQRAIPVGEHMPGIVDMLDQVLSVLRVSPNALSLRHFELFLLDALGLLPDYTTDMAGEPVRKEHSYWLVIEGLSPVAIDNAVEIPGAAALGISRGQLDESMGLRKACRFLIDTHLDGRTLRTRQQLSA